MIKATSTKEELMTAMKVINTQNRVRHEAKEDISPDDRNRWSHKVSDYWLKWSSPVHLRRQYIETQSELKGICRMWRNRYTDTMNADKIYSTISSIYMDRTTGEYGSSWVFDDGGGNTGGVKKNTMLIYSRHMPTGDVEFMDPVNNRSYVLKRGSTMAEKIRVIDT